VSGCNRGMGVTMSNRFIFAALACLMLGACITSGAQTPSGSPEIVVRGAKPDRVKAALVNAALNRRLQMKSDSTNMVVFERETSNAAASILLSTRMSGAPVDRMSFTLVEIPEGTRIVAVAGFVSNAGTGFEHGNTGPSAPVFNDELNSILAEVASSSAAVAQQQARR
jgi:hypothetical protein